MQLTKLSAQWLFLCLLLAPLSAEAASPLTYRYRHFLYTIPAATVATWQTPREVWTYNGAPVTPPAELRVDGDALPPLPAGMAKMFVTGWNPDTIAASLRERIAGRVDRAPGEVTISRTASGAITFDGVGMLGRSVDMDAAVRATIAALEEGAETIALPVDELQPVVHVEDDELREQGVKELVALGESDFTGSTQNRMHNIGVGLARFNGTLIPRDETFSFIKILGPVNASAGYRKELTILGDKTMPDYGGGLCQVSTTAYRGVWEAGFPIVQRRNHSYAVGYYAPQGTDATVYPPHTDVKFLNDSPGALVVQTYKEGKKAFFLYYGTKDDRSADVIGPYTWGHIPAPKEQRTEYTTEIPPGETKKVGEAVPGMKAQWFRIVWKGGVERIDSTSSNYEARPLFYQIGVKAEDLPAPSDEAPAEADPSA